MECVKRKMNKKKRQAKAHNFRLSLYLFRHFSFSVFGGKFFYPLPILHPSRFRLRRIPCCSATTTWDCRSIHTVGDCRANPTGRCDPTTGGVEAVRKPFWAVWKAFSGIWGTILGCGSVCGCVREVCGLTLLGREMWLLWTVSADKKTAPS